MNPVALSGRRGFLLAMGASGAASVAAVAYGANARAPGVVREPSPSEPSGYRETDHIRNYYKTTET